MIEKSPVKIGFVPSYRDFGPRTLPDWCVKLRQGTIQAFSAVYGAELITPSASPSDPRAIDAHQGYSPYGAVCNLDQAEAVATYFSREKVDAILIGALDFGDERSAGKIAETLKVPVLLFATREPDVPERASMARVSDSYCGTLSIASALYRRGITFHYAGIFLPDEPAFVEQLEEFVKAVSVVKALKGARIGQVGVRPATFETVGFDETALINKFNQNVIFIELSDIVAKARQMKEDDPQVIQKMDEIRHEVAQVTITDEWFSKAARPELTLSQFFTTNRLSAMGIQCWPAIQNLWNFSTCALFGRLTGQGMLTACETDILGSISMLVNFAAARYQTVPHFIDWTIQHRENENRFLAWHCGNAPVCLAADPHKTALRSRNDMKGILPADPGDSQAGLYQFQIKAGHVTICRLAEYHDQWKMLIAPGEIVSSDEELAGTWSWVELKDHLKLYRTLVEEGFIHHASLIHGDQQKALELACKFLDIKPVVVE